MALYNESQRNITSADALDMEKLVGLKAIVELFQAVNEQMNDRIVWKYDAVKILERNILNFWKKMI